MHLTWLDSHLQDLFAHMNEYLVQLGLEQTYVAYEPAEHFAYTLGFYVDSSYIS